MDKSSRSIGVSPLCNDKRDEIEMNKSGSNNSSHVKNLTQGSIPVKVSQANAASKAAIDP